MGPRTVKRNAWVCRAVSACPLPINEKDQPKALSTLPPASTGFAAISTKAMTQDSGPRLTQLWTVPRWTMTSPAFRCVISPVQMRDITRLELHIDLALHNDGIIERV